MTRALVTVRHGGTLTYIHDKFLAEQWIRSLRASNPRPTADYQSGSGRHGKDYNRNAYSGNDRHGVDLDTVCYVDAMRVHKKTIEINPKHSMMTEL